MMYLSVMTNIRGAGSALFVAVDTEMMRCWGLADVDLEGFLRGKVNVTDLARVMLGGLLDTLARVRVRHIR
jgi:hypothetical protein